MIGAIAGDVIGSVHEGAGTKSKDFPLFNEDCRFSGWSRLVLLYCVLTCFHRILTAPPS